MLIKSRHAEVVAALRDPRLSAGLDGRHLHEQARAFRLPGDWEERWAEGFAALSDECELIGDLAAPLCLDLAAAVTGIAAGEAERLSPLARKLFEAESAESAAVELMSRFQDALLVQAFAALSHSFAAFLGNAWLALLEHPSETTSLAADPAMLPDAIEELLRYAGPSIAVFREGVEIRLAEANRDPSAFPEPCQLQLGRRPAGHVAFGVGPHACAGAALIRLAARAPLWHFATHFAGRTVTFAAVPETGPRLRSLRSLRIRG
jgi:cytochrome P450